MRRAGGGTVVNVSSMGGRFTVGIDVVLIEPGLITTEFGDTAAAGVEAGGPYADFNRHVAESHVTAYEGPIAKYAGGGPDDVAKVIEKALTARSPRARYRVTASARMLITQRRLMPDRVWDRFMNTQFPHPKP